MQAQTALFRGRKASKLEIVDVLENDDASLSGLVDVLPLVVEKPVQKSASKKVNTPAAPDVPADATPVESGESVSPFMCRRG